MVDVKFVRDWHDYLACGLDYIVVVVDGRGTGFKGRNLRNTVKDNLGYWETVDQIAVARCVCSPLWLRKPSSRTSNPRGFASLPFCLESIVAEGQMLFLI